MDCIRNNISEELLVETCWCSPEEIESITTMGGSYILLLRLETTESINLPNKVSGQLLPGWYVYCGSARNKGGIRARLKHHFQSNKKRHWHIDRLTIKAVQMSALPVPDGDECKLLTKLLQLPGFSIAIMGFGSSDCRDCESHLLASTMQ